MCLYTKRLERGHLVWPVTETGRVSLTPAQLSMLLEGLDWRIPQRVKRPKLAGCARMLTRDSMDPICNEDSASPCVHRATCWPHWRRSSANG